MTVKHSHCAQFIEKKGVSLDFINQGDLKQAHQYKKYIMTFPRYIYFKE